MTESQGRSVPTIGGILMFGSDRRAVFPDAWVQVARFAGADRSVILDQAEITGPMPSWIDDAYEFVDRHLTRAVEIEGPRRLVVRPIPLEAVREVIVNAVIHADYSQPGGPIRIGLYDDRLEVESPGMLPFGLTVEEIRRGVSRVRNRMLARILRELGYVEQWGSGIGRMERACTAAGLDAPRFEEIGGRFRVTIAMERQAAASLDETDRAIVALLGERGATTSEVASGIGRSTRTARVRLARLVDRGVVVEIGSGPTDPHRRYALAMP